MSSAALLKQSFNGKFKSQASSVLPSMSQSKSSAIIKETFGNYPMSTVSQKVINVSPHSSSSFQLLKAQNGTSSLCSTIKPSHSNNLSHIVIENSVDDLLKIVGECDEEFTGFHAAAHCFRTNILSVKVFLKLCGFL